MNKKLRVLILIITVSLLIGTLPSTSALAGSRLASSNHGAGQVKLNQITDYPCGTPLPVHNAVPLFLCSGYGGTGSWIAFPLRTWATEPNYPLANYPFYIALGTTRVQNYFNFPTTNRTYPQMVDIRGIKTEIRLVPIEQDLISILDTNFNGMIDYSYGDHMSVYAGKLTNRWHDLVEEEFKKLFNPPKVTSVISEKYYHDESGSAVDTILLRAFSLNSSYFADNPTTYRGEPAYRIVIESYYKVEAKTDWQRHRFWEYLPDGTKTVCKLGPGSSGNFNCVTPGGQLGHIVTEETYAWKWGPWHTDGGDSGWKVVSPGLSVDSVRWPDGSIHDHIPLVVYQSQPLLTQP